MIYDKIPTELRLDVLLKIVYGEFTVDGSINQWIEKCLNDETQDMKQHRLECHKHQLSPYLNEDGTLTVYRGISNSSCNAFELSWSLSYDVARVFATNYGDGSIMKGSLKIEDILVYNSNINENELIVLPDRVEVLSIETVEYDKTFLEQWQADSKHHDKIMSSFIKEMAVSTVE